MKPYTIIFDNGNQVGSHYNAITVMHRVITNDLKRLLDENYGGSVWMVFEGHPILEGEGEFEFEVTISVHWHEF